MIIAVTSTGNALDSPVDPRFGRCSYFAIVDTKSDSFTALANSSTTLGSGAGIEAARVLSEHGVEAVITGQCGPNAHATLSAAGIQIFDGASGTVREAVEKYSQGKFSSNAKPSGPAHAGMAGTQGAPGTGRGTGLGQGRGMGGGRGQGGGRGGGGAGGGGGGKGRR